MSIKEKAEEQLIELNKNIDHYINTLMNAKQKIEFKQLSEIAKIEHIRNKIYNSQKLELYILSKWNLEKIL